MKKNRLTEFFKGKGYYVLLFVGVIAIAAVALIGSNLSSNDKDDGKEYVDLNDSDNNIASDQDGTQFAENNPTPDNIVNNVQDDNVVAGDETNDNANQEVVSNEDMIEYEGYAQDEENNTDLAQADNTTDVADAVEEPEAVETTGKTVQADSVPHLESLSFKADDTLLWPVEGNVIMNYSMDHTIYHATLMLYKCNPAIIIDAEVGTEVVAAARGIVSSIEDNDETGLTLITNIGDGYSLVYGQLQDVKLEVGDKVNEGAVIGTIAKPTRYFSVEGSNLYFKVLENELTVNPMKLLR